MSCLLYCVFPGGLPPDLEMPAGVGGPPVFLVEHKGLSAVLSELPPSDSPPGISEILAYEQVVEFFHRQRTVIPMRYGCRPQTASEAIRLLEEHYSEYEVLLRKLEGSVEMGIQVLSANLGDQADPNGSGVAAESLLPGLSGTDYLAAKRLHYLSIDRGTRQQSRLVQTLCSMLEGLYADHKIEARPLANGRLQSIYFLVPRDAIASFRQTAQEIFKKQNAKLLLSGPWPPYNFV